MTLLDQLIESTTQLSDCMMRLGYPVGSELVIGMPVEAYDALYTDVIKNVQMLKVPMDADLSHGHKWFMFNGVRFVKRRVL